MTDRELMQEALDALTYVGDKDIYSGTIDALRARLAQPEPAQCDGGQCGIGGYCKQCPKTQLEQEPVAWADKVDIDRDGHDLWVSRQKPAKDGVPLYTASPQREWQGLTEEERLEILGVGGEAAVLYVTEAKLREKNNG